ncbi:MAG: glycosyl transferase family 28 [Clostridia bacterium]|nr:glycosyl transferase family 28 [Clostridia bacterium]
MILLVTHWTGGDVLPFIKMGVRLRKEGHCVVLFTHCKYEEIAKQRGLAFEALDTMEEFEEMNRDLWMLTDPIHDKESVLKFNHKYHGKERLLREYKKIVPYCKKEEVFILARHRSSIAGLLVAEKLRIPYASVVLAPNYLDHMILHEELFGKEMIEEINSARDILGLYKIKSWKDWLYSPKVFLGVWPSWFAKKEPTWPNTLIPIGFMQGEKTDGNAYERFDVEVKRMLERNKQIVLITGGSSRMIAAEFYAVAAKACEIAGCQAILVTHYDEQVPLPLPDGMIYVKNIDMPYLMKYVSIIIHHGGMGTLSEALEAGVPQIILPHITDGPDNAHRLSALGLAKVFPLLRWDAYKIAEALQSDLITQLKHNSTEYAERMKRDQVSNWITLIENSAINKEYITSDLAEQNKERKKEEVKSISSKTNLTAQQKLYLIKQKYGY